MLGYQIRLEVATRLRVLGEAESAILIADAAEIGRMLNGLIASLERARNDPDPSD